MQPSIAAHRVGSASAGRGAHLLPYCGSDHRSTTPFGGIDELRQPFPDVDIPDALLFDYLFGDIDAVADEPALIDGTTGR